MTEVTEDKALTTSKAVTVRDYLVTRQAELSTALPRHMTADRMIRVALTAMTRDPKLFDCDPKSLYKAVMQAAQLGLEPDGILGQAYLIPFRNNKRGGVYEAQFIPGYKGLIDLARRSGQVLSIGAHVVYEKDQFEFQHGTEEYLRHVPYLGDDRGERVAVYAAAKLRDGGSHFDVLRIADVEKIRKASQRPDAGPWKDHWEQMARKTAIRRLCNYLSLSPEIQRAVALDSQAEAGIPQVYDSDVIDIDAVQDPAQAATDAAAAALREKIAGAKAPETEATPVEPEPGWEGHTMMAKLAACSDRADVDDLLQYPKWRAGVVALSKREGAALDKAVEKRLAELGTSRFKSGLGQLEGER